MTPRLSLAVCIASLITAAVTTVIAQTPAPNFTVTTLQGRFSLEQNRGKVVLLDFWGTWCPPCKAFAPTLVALNKRLAGQPFVTLSVAADEKSERAWGRFIAEQKMTWPQFLDTKYQLLELFGVHEFPTFVIIDATGVIREQRTGEGDAEWLNARVDHWLAAARAGRVETPLTSRSAR